LTTFSRLLRSRDKRRLQFWCLKPHNFTISMFICWILLLC
jgi:hypothetical protein